MIILANMPLSFATISYNILPGDIFGILRTLQQRPELLALIITQYCLDLFIGR